VRKGCSALSDFADLSVISDANFDEVLNASGAKFWLLDFGADWCEPCKAMDPIVADIAEEFRSLVRVGRVDLDESPGLAERFKVVSIPSLLLLEGPTVKLRLRGVQSRDEIRAALSEAVTSVGN
jgi:thioredoxin 1